MLRSQAPVLQPAPARPRTPAQALSGGSRPEANLAKNREKLAELLEKEARMAERASELEDQIASAWNDDWRERAEGWLEELEEKLRSLREFIERVEGWIEEDEEKLSR